MSGRKKGESPLGRYRTGGEPAEDRIRDVVDRIRGMLRRSAADLEQPGPGERYDAATEKAIDGIYENIRSGRVLLYPALAGTRYNTGEYVFMYDDLFDLLLRYGYDADLVEKFIDRFWRTPTADGLPIVMMSRNKTEICDDDVVKPLE